MTPEELSEKGFEAVTRVEVIEEEKGRVYVNNDEIFIKKESK